jgi:Toprim domain
MTKNNTSADDDALDYATLDALRGDDTGYDGPLDHPCPLCGPGRSTSYNQVRPVLRTWRLGIGVISFKCARCDTQGFAQGDAAQMLQPRPLLPVVPARKPRIRSGNDFYVRQLWETASPVLPAVAQAYFRFRRIPLDRVPRDVLRFHPQCPWQGERLPCLLARYSDAVSGEPKGIWRRPIDGLKPMTLGPMGGCVIRLWPEIGKRLVIGEGVETTLAAATRILHRGRPLRPAWATGCANNLRRFPVIDGVEQLIVLVDNDESGTGQQAAAECARRWCDAGREVIRLVPSKPGTDFNDLVRA